MQRRKKSIKTETPGPGSYNAASEFGHLELMVQKAQTSPRSSTSQGMRSIHVMNSQLQSRTQSRARSRNEGQRGPKMYSSQLTQYNESPNKMNSSIISGVNYNQTMVTNGYIHQ